MPDSPSKRTPPQMGVAVPANLPLPQPLGANFFHFTLVAGEVQMLVGSLNLLRIHEASQRGESATLTPDISHRFTLSPFGIANLQAQLAEFGKLVAEAEKANKRT